jgi:hypothetical protein
MQHLKQVAKTPSILSEPLVRSFASLLSLGHEHDSLGQGEYGLINQNANSSAGLCAGLHTDNCFRFGCQTSQNSQTSASSSLCLNKKHPRLLSLRIFVFIFTEAFISDVLQ